MNYQQHFKDLYLASNSNLAVICTSYLELLSKARKEGLDTIPIIEAYKLVCNEILSTPLYPSLRKTIPAKVKTKVKSKFIHPVIDIMQANGIKISTLPESATQEKLNEHVCYWFAVHTNGRKAANDLLKSGNILSKLDEVSKLK